jgi:glutamyl-tRNA synthetase
MSVRVRIAPSPTGNLHIGTARTAVFNWLFARHQGGKFILRIEDTDLERSRAEYTENILDGLTWLGLTWDEGPFFQTKRTDLYQQAIQTLLDKGLAYRSYETPEELDAMREAQKARGEAPRYDNRHRNITPEQSAAYEAEGRTSVIRFIINDDREITWHDLVRGNLSWRGRDLGGDMVISRAAPAGEIGPPLYNLVVVVDDIDMQISHVIRGEDHIGNTPKQILLYEALGASVPEFGHTPLILNQAGAKLSKRDGVTSISDFQRMGYTSEAMVNYMTLLGWSPPEPMTERFSLTEAAEQFGFERVNKAGAKFDWDKLNWLNSQYLHEMPPSQLVDLLIPYWQAAGFEFDAVGDRAWLEQLASLIGPSLVRLEDAVEMSRYLFVADLGFSEEANTQLRQEGASAVLEGTLSVLANQQPLTESGIQEVVKQVTKERSLKKGLVMRTLRAALTKDMHGPDLAQSWLLLHQHQLDQQRLQEALTIATS